MMRHFIILALLFIGFSTFGQTDSSRIYLSFGVGGGLLFQSSVDLEDYPIDLYTQERELPLYLDFGVGLELRDKSRIELGYTPMSFRLDKPTLASKYIERLPNYHVYHDFNVDNTNSTGNGLNLHHLELRYLRIYEFGKFRMSPVLGAAIGIWTHRNLKYVLRDKTTNHYSTYRYDFKQKAAFSFKAQMRFGIQRFPNAFLTVTYTGVPSRYNYELKVFENEIPGIEFSENIQFKRFVQVLNFGILFQENNFE